MKHFSTTKIEFGKLHPINIETITYSAFIALMLSASAYFLDHARIAAFVLIPFTFIFVEARKVGITYKNTPVLNCFLWLSAFVAYCLAFAWVLYFPR